MINVRAIARRNEFIKEMTPGSSADRMQKLTETGHLIGGMGFIPSSFALKWKFGREDKSISLLQTQIRELPCESERGLTFH
jgi:hypothetical protein